jgi:hypothetical protein
MDSATSAKRNESTPPTENVLDRLQRLAVENPDLVEYQLTTELEAQELLTAMAAMLKVMMKDVHHRGDKRTIQDYANQYRKAVIQGNAFGYIHELNSDDGLELFGLKITTGVAVLQ